MSLIGRLVGVTWRDAQADMKAQMGAEEISAAQSFIFISYGILVRDDRDRPELADRLIAVAHEAGAGGVFRGVTFIPLELLVDIQDLGNGQAKRKRLRRPRPDPEPQI